MKKVLIGLILGAVLTLPIGAYAWSVNQMATPIAGTKCERNADSSENDCQVIIDRIKDGKNTCYIARETYGSQSSISCVVSK